MLNLTTGSLLACNRSFSVSDRPRPPQMLFCNTEQAFPAFSFFVSLTIGLRSGRSGAENRVFLSVFFFRLFNKVATAIDPASQNSLILRAIHFFALERRPIFVWAVLFKSSSMFGYRTNDFRFAIFDFRFWKNRRP